MPTDTPPKTARNIFAIQMFVLVLQMVLTSLCLGLYLAWRNERVMAKAGQNQQPVPVQSLSFHDEVVKQHDAALVNAARVDLKIIGLAILSYVQDNGGNFPKATDDTSTVLSPYLTGEPEYKNPALLLPQHGYGAFVYIFHGGKVPDDAAATVIIGYKDSIDGKNRRLNLFADGHVKLAPDPK